MATPVTYNTTSTPLPPAPQGPVPPTQAPETSRVVKRYRDGSVDVLKGKNDTIDGLARAAWGNDQLVQGSGPHLDAYLRRTPAGDAKRFPKPGEVFHVPPFWDVVGHQNHEALDKANTVRDTQPHANARQSDGTTRMSQAIMPPSGARAGVGFSGHGHRVMNLGVLVYGSRW